MRINRGLFSVGAGLMFGFALLGCDATIPDLGGIIDDVLNGNNNGSGNGNDNGGGGIIGPSATLESFASNTSGASGLAVRPSDGAVFAVHAEGLFGPIMDGADLSTMDPLGATNLADEALFDMPQDSLVLAISDDGRFWIGSFCCQTMGVVAAEGGEAEQYLGLFDASELKPETLALVPFGFSGPQIMPGQILVGQTTSFSRLVAINAATDESAVDVGNPADEEIDRYAHHLTFGADGNLYSATENSALTRAGLQQIATDGTPTDLDWSVGVAADSFVVLENGDFVIAGNLQESGATNIEGIVYYDTDADALSMALEISDTQRSENDEMVLTQDGTILLAQPNLNRIVRVVINE